MVLKLAVNNAELAAARALGTSGSRRTWGAATWLSPPRYSSWRRAYEPRRADSLVLAEVGI